VVGRLYDDGIIPHSRIFALDSSHIDGFAFNPLPGYATIAPDCFQRPVRHLMTGQAMDTGDEAFNPGLVHQTVRRLPAINKRSHDNCCLTSTHGNTSCSEVSNS
jgi:hypothetical protein